MLSKQRKVGLFCIFAVVGYCVWTRRLPDLTVPLPEPQKKGTRICENDERIRTLREYCAANGDIELKSTPNRAVANGLMVNDKHKILFCLHAKVACTTWAAILAKNILPADTRQRLDKPFSDLDHLQLHYLDEEMYSEEDIQYRLDNYYKVMVVRHPYDRLQSFFHGKFSTGSYNATLGRQVMAAYHPDLPRGQKLSGAVSFSDIVRWIEDGHKDEHWIGPYHKKCFPCRVQYDYVVKLETFARDSEYVITHRLSGRGLNTSMNVRRSAFGSGRQLQLFHNLTSYQMQFLRYRLQPDLDMFGYSFDERTKIAKCGDEDQCC